MSIFRGSSAGAVGEGKSCWGGDLRWKFKKVLNMNFLEGVWKEELEWAKTESSKVLAMEENFGEQ